MHDNQITIDLDIARALIAAQFPHWADLPLQPVSSWGTDHNIFRLGETMALRFPMRPSAVEQIGKEKAHLPVVAAHLPVEVSAPLAEGQPSDLFAWPWSICRWVEGDTLDWTTLQDKQGFANDLAAVIKCLHRLPVLVDLPPGSHNFGRGCPLKHRDRVTRHSISLMSDAFDADELAHHWNVALDAPEHKSPSVWLHGDLAPGNIIVRDGVLAGLIDWGGLASGDPAVDLMVAWSSFDPATRAIFRARIGVDDAAWSRGKGWALSVAILQWPYYRVTNPSLADSAWRTIEAIFADAQ